MTIKMPETLWYEDENGNKFPHEPGDVPASKEQLYQHTRSVSMRHHVLGSVRAEDVEACDHGKTKRTGGWIDGVEGRECTKCRGTQTRHTGEPWPEKWESGGCYDVVTMNAGWNDEQVTLMVRSGKYTAREAALIAAVCCERCMNVLLHHYECPDDGYPMGSDKEALCGTSCELCDQVTEECKESAIPCKGEHEFLISADGKHWMCRHCDVPGVRLTLKQMDEHVEQGGKPFEEEVISETIFKYKVRTRSVPSIDNDTPCNCAPDPCDTP